MAVQHVTIAELEDVQIVLRCASCGQRGIVLHEKLLPKGLTGQHFSCPNCALVLMPAEELTFLSALREIRARPQSEKPSFKIQFEFLDPK